MSNRFFRVSIPRRKVVTYERLVWAADEAGAIALVNEGTAWPQSYDESATEVIDEDPVVIEITDPEMLELWKTDDPEYDWDAHAARERAKIADEPPSADHDDLALAADDYAAPPTSDRFLAAIRALHDLVDQADPSCPLGVALSKVGMAVKP